MARPTTQTKDNQREIRLHGSRVGVMSVIVGVLLCGLVARAFYLQVLRYEHYSTISDENRIQTSPIAPNRGLILDRNGKVLAENRPSFSLNIVKEQTTDLPALISTLQALLKLSPEEVNSFRERIAHGTRPLESLPLHSRLTDEELAIVAVNRHRLPGVRIETELVRYYPWAETLAHGLGYVNRINEDDLDLLDPVNYDGTNYVGRTGVERQYESVRMAASATSKWKPTPMAASCASSTASTRNRAATSASTLISTRKRRRTTAWPAAVAP